MIFRGAGGRFISAAAAKAATERNYRMAANVAAIGNNAAKSAGRASKVGTWLRNRPKWQKYAMGAGVGIVGARAVFGGRRDYGGTPYGY
jgi:hypothetical protein